MNARKLHMFEQFKTVCMNPDLTRAERVVQLEELAQRKADGEKGIYICRGLIVHKSNAVKHKSNPVKYPTLAFIRCSAELK